jgi:protease I
VAFNAPRAGIASITAANFDSALPAAAPRLQPSTALYMKELAHKKIAILVTDGFEQVEFTKPKEALEDAGADVSVVSLKTGKIRGMKHDEPGDKFRVDLALEDADAEEFDGLMLPGGLMNPDTLRQEGKALDFVRSFFEAGKPVAAICHAPWVLIDAGVIKGRRLTSWPGIKTDVRNAGGEWVDEEVVCDQGLVTSRNPDDIPAFNEKMIEEFGEGRHEQQAQKAGRALSHA